MSYILYQAGAYNSAQCTCADWAKGIVSIFPRGSFFCHRYEQERMNVLLTICFVQLIFFPKFQLLNGQAANKLSNCNK